MPFIYLFPSLIVHSQLPAFFKKKLPVLIKHTAGTNKRVGQINVFLAPWKHLVQTIEVPECCEGVIGLLIWYLFEKETLVQMFSCNFCEIFKITFLTGHLWTTTSVCYIQFDDLTEDLDSIASR